jgi:hypothetical protein
MFAKATGFRVRRAALRGGGYGRSAVSSPGVLCGGRQRADAEKNGPESVRIVNRCRTQCVGEIRWLHMTKVSKQGKLTNPNTDAHTPETASNVGTGYEVGRAAVTAITMLAQTTHRICRAKVERAHRPPDDRVFIG